MASFYYIFLLSVLNGCLHSPMTVSSTKNIATNKTEKTTHFQYLTTRMNEPTVDFKWNDKMSRVNDSTLISKQELLERFGSNYANFGLLDWNDDHYPDLFFEYYGESGCGIKNKIDVYEFDPKTKDFKSEYYTYDNPAFYFDLRIITSHYWGNSGGYAAKFNVENGKIDTLEWIHFVFYTSSSSFDSILYNYTIYPSRTEKHYVDTAINLPPEYRYERIIND